MRDATVRVHRTLMALTLQLLLSLAIDSSLAIPIGPVQVTGPRWLAMPARAFGTRTATLLRCIWLPRAVRNVLPTPTGRGGQP